MKMSIARIFLAFAILLVATRCGKDNNCKMFAEAPVNITIYPNSTEYQELNTVTGWVYLTAPRPSRGIIVYRSSLNHFKAYERTCPHDPQEPGAILQVDKETVLFAYDTVCNSRFILTNGTPFDGPSKCPMREYRTSYDGNRLRIYN